ncbi:MAG: hypothetical protein ACOYT8_04830 [Candidatus Dependentiae bacterium]
MSNYYQNNSEKKFDFSSLTSEKNVSIALTALVAIGLLIGGWFWYRSYTLSQVQAAQKVLSSCLAEYEKVRAGGSLAQWQTLDAMCSAGYEKHKNSPVAPYFLAIQADAFLAQGKINEALALLDKMVTGLPTMSPMYYLYQTKKALVGLDQDEDTLKQSALNELEKLAYNNDNPNADYALYYLGEYYWHEKKIDQARQVWQDLETRFKSDSKNGQSPWAVLAQYKLQQTGYES